MHHFTIQCTICEFQSNVIPQSYALSSLQKHSQAATGTRPHHCDMCNRNPHNFVKGFGWVEKEWWGSDEADKVVGMSIEDRKKYVQERQ